MYCKRATLKLNITQGALLTRNDSVWIINIPRRTVVRTEDVLLCSPALSYRMYNRHTFYILWASL